MSRTYTRFLFSPLFLAGLGVLLLNDFVLKTWFANELTGKLSDLAGLFIFPFFFATFARTRVTAIYLVTAFAFVIWKSPLSQPLIDFVNSAQLFRIGRTLDYSDLIALAILPLSYLYFRRIEVSDKGILEPLRRAGLVSVVLMSLFAFTATQFEDDRHVALDRRYEFKIRRVEFERRLHTLTRVRDITIEKTTDTWPKNKYPDVKTRPNEYYLRFTILEKYCESKDLDVFVSFEDRQDKVVVDYMTVRYWCPTKPSSDDKQRLTSIFENFFVDPIQLTN